jgi:trigger factor
MEMVGMDDEKYKSQFREKAENQVKGALLLDALAEKEGIKVEDEQLDEKIREIASERGIDYEYLKQFYENNKNAAENMKGQLREDRIFSLLEKGLTIREVSREELTQKPEIPETNV